MRFRFTTRNVLQSSIFVLPLLAIVLWSSLVTLRNTARIAATGQKPGAPGAVVFPRADYAALAHSQHSVGSDFAAYYAGNQGPTWLGTAITPELPTANGQIQIYQNGALQRTNGKNAAVTPVAVVAALISAGAEVPLGGPNSTLTYAALRGQADAAALTRAPWWWQSGADPATLGIFVPQSLASDLGHYIPALFAAYLVNLSPAWQNLVGAPLTEAQAGTISVQGVPHRLVAQAFDHAVLYYDRDAGATPQVTLQATGADYIAINGPPSLAGASGRQLWATGSPTLVYPAPGLSAPNARFLANFPVTLTSDSVWLGGVLWYKVAWQTWSAHYTGWVNADQMSFAPPMSGGALADLSALSPQLGAYAQTLGTHAAVAIYDPDDKVSYVYNPTLPSKMGSTFKIPILFTLLSQAEAQGRSLTSNEQTLAQLMIENSDNDAADALYQEVNYNVGINQFMQQVGVRGLNINGVGFGWSTITPVAMEQLLDDLDEGTILTASDRQYALSLMGHIRSDQQMGVGETAPSSANVAMKDGWITDDVTNLWITDSVGIIKDNGHTYIIAVYVHDYTDIDNGWVVVNTICGDAAQALLGSHN